MQRTLSALITWIVLAALVRSVAATDLNHCSQSTLPETDEIGCLGQYEGYSAPDLGNIDTETISRAEHKDPPNFPLSSFSDTSPSTASVSTATSDTTRSTSTTIASLEKAPHPKGFIHGIFCNIVDCAGHHHATSPSVVSTPSAETDVEMSPKTRRNVRYTKDSATSQKSRLFGGIRQRPPFHW